MFHKTAAFILGGWTGVPGPLAGSSQNLSVFETDCQLSQCSMLACPPVSCNMMQHFRSEEHSRSGSRSESLVGEDTNWPAKGRRF